MVEISEKDIELIIRIKNSDQAAYKQLYFTYAEKLYGFLWRKISNEDLAKDLVQDLFFKLWINRKNLDENQSIKAYLYRSANNLAIDHYRKKKIFISDENEEIHFGNYNLDLSFDVTDEILKEVNKLPEMQKKVFLLSRFEELRYKEIAELLKISPKTVESHISKALAKLRVSLKHLTIISFFYFFYLTDRVYTVFERIFY